MAEQKVSVGRIVHVFNRFNEGVEPAAIGPYPAIVWFVHPDGTSVEVQAFPINRIVLAQSVAIPYTDGAGNEKRQVWWAWPERV